MVITEQVVYCDGATYKLEPSAFEKMNRLSVGGCVNVYPEKKQEILGFGGAFTESSAYNYSLMSKDEKKRTLELLFGASGLRFNFCRICLGSSDFALDEYSYIKDGDYSLSTFSIERDKKYVIPFIRDAQKAAADEIFFFASPWSPPAFFKTSGVLKQGGSLKKEHYELYAEYMAKFVEAYRAEGIKISALTLQNEPDAAMTWESCKFTAKEEAEFLLCLHKTLAAHNLDVKLLFWDHNKGDVYNHAKAVYPVVGDKAWGMGFHWYEGSHYDELSLVKQLYPDKVLIETEFCYNITYRYNTYRAEIQNNLNHGVSAICDWNMILDDDGGPFHNRNVGDDAPVCFLKNENRVEKHGLYGQMYMFSHYIRRGAVMLHTSSFDEDVTVSAALNPDGTIVVQLHTKRREAQQVSVKIGYESAKVTVLPDAVVTLVVKGAEI